MLISGESGVGKELFAQSIHNHSNRRNNPFVALNCASFPSELIASELFGYEAGAFTDASKKGHMGKFELANSGTLFLDEISELPYDSQSKLLRVLDVYKRQHLLRPVRTDNEAEPLIHLFLSSTENCRSSLRQKFRFPVWSGFPA